MKIILSKKGFDTSNSIIPSPILPDGTLLSMPIPAEKDRESYSDLQYEGVSYASILEQLIENSPRREEKTKKDYKKNIIKGRCHLDPDIRENVRKNSPSNWKPAFGQQDGKSTAQSTLSNCNVGNNDLFLFYGRYQKTEGDIEKGTLRYVYGAPKINVIYGYLQIEKVITDKNIIQKDYPYHPHSEDFRFINQNPNALYIPRNTLSFDSSKLGWGVFDFSEDRVLTAQNHTMSSWKKIPALSPDCFLQKFYKPDENCYKRNNKRGQEYVSKDDVITVEWAKSLFDK